MPTRLEARQLEVRYAADANPVLSQVSLALEPGIFTAVIGPNGSGKSTLIRTLSRTLKPVGGAVLLDELDLYSGHSARSSARLVGVVPQDTHVALGFSVREVVRMGRAPHLPPRPFAAETADDERVVTEALHAAQVADLAGRSVSSLSGGERQRVLFARALAQSAEVLLLDEPTASLDLHHQDQTLTLARDLAHQGGKTVLAVLHDLNLAAAYADRLVLMDQGRIAATGSPTKVLTPENVQRVYGVRVWVRPHPVTGRPLVLPLPELTDERAVTRPSVHVLCGAGTGAGLLVALHRLGFPLTAGALNAGDTDADASQMLGVPFALENSFSPLSEVVLVQAAHLALSADVVLLTDMPFGPANLATLEAALMLRRLGKPVLCLQNTSVGFQVRDFTGGAAAALWGVLLAEGAVPLPDREAVLDRLEKWTLEGK